MKLEPASDALLDLGVYARWGYHMDDCPRGLERWVNWRVMYRFTDRPAFDLMELLSRVLGDG